MFTIEGLGDISFDHAVGYLHLFYYFTILI